LAPLPIKRFEIFHQYLATVGRNSHVMLGADKHYYSVPSQYIRRKVKLQYSKSTVKVYHKYNRIAVHQRNLKAYHYSTQQQNLPSTHQFLVNWSPQTFIQKAASIDPSVEELVIKVLEQKQHPEQAHKSCMGILSLEKKVGASKLISASKRALEHGIYSYRTVKTILEKGLDQLNVDKSQLNDQLPSHNNIRGNYYYK
jgi:hypothetical protein